MSLGQNNQYFYTPDVKIWVNTVFNGVVDVSEDLVSFTVSRAINAVSSAEFYLSNNNFKYTPGSLSGDRKPPIINTMDGVVISCKRENYVQVFTGFITYSPLVTLIPTSVQFRASCTLYKAQQSYWDAGALEFQNLVPSLLFNYNENLGDYQDGGIGTGIHNILTKVCNWNNNNIIINPIPQGWISLANSVYQDGVGQQNLQTQALLESKGIINGNTGTLTGTAISGNVIPPISYTTSGPITIPPGQQISVVSMPIAALDPFIKNGSILQIASDLALSRLSNSSFSDYWCCYPWPFFTSDTIVKGSKEETLTSTKINFLSGNGVASYSATAQPFVARLLNVAGTSASATTQSNLYTTFTNPHSTTLKINGITVDGNTMIVGNAAYRALGGTVDAKGNSVGKITININGFMDPSSTLPLKGGTISPSNASILSASSTSNNKNPNLEPTTQVSTYGELALYYAEQQTGIPYSWGGGTASGPSRGIEQGANTVGFDCSHLVYYAYCQAGITNVVPPTETQYRVSTVYRTASAPQVGSEKIFDPNTDTLLAGDVLFYSYDGINVAPDHVQLYTGTPNQCFAAYHTGAPIGYSTVVGQTSPYSKTNTQGWSYVCRPGLQKNNNNLPSPRSLSLTAPGQITSATSNFSTQYQSPNIDGTSTVLVGSPSAWVTDEPALTTIQTLAQTGLRSFQSAPNGDFVAWFPDYFGLYGTAPAMTIRDIEIVDLVMYHDDTELYTHIGVSGDPTGLGTGVNLADWMMTPGLITIQQQAVMNMLFGHQPTNPNGPYSKSDLQAFLQRYGVRPYVDEEPQIRSPLMTFMYAWQEFMYLWASQYNSQATFTFLPELYPGMLIWLPEHNLQFYVQEVTHQGSRDGGFSTQVTITCPALITDYKKDKSGQITSVTAVPLDFGYPIQP